MKQILDLIPKEYFVENLKDNTLGVIKIALLREVVNPMIIRSNFADETITFKASEDKDIVEIPARKMKSKEKLRGLKICREMKVIDDSFRYNVIKKSEYLANPNSILFGDSVTESSDSVGITSRVIYDWAYSIRDVNEITDTFQHNALSEGGTMWNEEEGKLRQSLFQVQYVMPKTYFPHFLTLENVTPELLVHLLSSVLHENRYGAQSTTLGANMVNHLVGIGFDKFEAPVNSFSISDKWKEGEDMNFGNVKAAIETAMKGYYGDNFKEGKPFKELIDTLWNGNTLQEHYNKAQQDCEKLLKETKVIK
ncbi:MAG: type I-D CRISPR-associated protein Cas7/Csc2 [bacterium]